MTQSYSADLDPATNNQNLLNVTQTGFVLRQLGGTPGAGPATVKSLGSYEYLDGSRQGTVVPSDGAWDTQTMVGGNLSFVQADVAVGTRWAGVLSSDFSPVESSYVDQDTLRILDAGNLIYERSQQSGSFRLVDGKLEVTVGGAVFTYTRLSPGPRGEERWLAEKRVDAALLWVYEPAVFKAQAALGFTPASIAQRWESYINASVSADKFFIELSPDGIGRGISVNAAGQEFPTSSGFWDIGADGQMTLRRYDCTVGAAGCVPFHQRTWQLLGSVGRNIVVLERLKIGSSYDQYRVNVYTGP